MLFLHLDPWNQVSKLQIGPSPGNKNRAAVLARIPVKFGTGSEGKVRENYEELEPHLLVALARWEMVGRGLVDGEQRWLV